MILWMRGHVSGLSFSCSVDSRTQITVSITLKLPNPGFRIVKKPKMNYTPMHRFPSKCQINCGFWVGMGLWALSSSIIIASVVRKYLLGRHEVMGTQFLSVASAPGRQKKRLRPNPNPNFPFFVTQRGTLILR